MAESFDPFHKWLGIPPAEQPASHYRLLGVSEFESDPEVIEAAADQRMEFLHTVAHGNYAEESQQLLNLIASARLCLLNSEKKAAYDADLRSVGTSVLSGEQGPPPLPGAGTTGESTEQTGLESLNLPQETLSEKRTRTGTGKSQLLIWLGGGAAMAAVITVAVVAVIIATRTQPEPRLIIEWPMSEREGGELLINDESRALGDEPMIEFELSPGTYRIEMRRKGFRQIIKSGVKLDKGDVRRYKLQWKKS